MENDLFFLLKNNNNDKIHYHRTFSCVKFLSCMRRHRVSKPADISLGIILLRLTGCRSLSQSLWNCLLLTVVLPLWKFGSSALSLVASPLKENALGHFITWRHYFKTLTLLRSNNVTQGMLFFHTLIHFGGKKHPIKCCFNTFLFKNVGTFAVFLQLKTEFSFSSCCVCKSYSRGVKINILFSSFSRVLQRVLGLPSTPSAPLTWQMEW